MSKERDIETYIDIKIQLGIEIGDKYREEEGEKSKEYRTRI